MKAALLSSLVALGLALLTPGCSSTGGGCAVTCPVGCNVSPDCTTCVAESAQAGLGTPCNTDNDCCNGSCLNGTCTANALGVGGSGSSSGGGATTGHTTTGGGTGGHGTTGGSASGSGGGTKGCTPSPTPSPTSDAQCSSNGTLVCNPEGQCVPNCNAAPTSCPTGETCQVNGHCESTISSGGNGGGGGNGGNGGGGSAGSAGSTTGAAGSTTGGGSASGGSSAASTSSGGTPGSSSSTGGSTTGTSSGGGTGGSSTGGACGGTLQEYGTCTSTSQCACPLACVGDGSGTSFCLQPCSSYQSCQNYEICDTKLAVPSCYPNFCTSPWGACAAGNDTGSGQTGTCNVYGSYSNGSEGWYGVCFAGGSLIAGEGCNFNATYATAGSQLCAVGDFCGQTTTGDYCYQGCDPSASLGAPACPGGQTCYPNPCDPTTDVNCLCSSSTCTCDPSVDTTCNPFFGVCQ